MENHRHAAKEDSPAFADKECNRFLSSHFRDQASVERSTLSEIASASASERGFSTHGSLRFCGTYLLRQHFGILRCQVVEIGQSLRTLFCGVEVGEDGNASNGFGRG